MLFVISYRKKHASSKTRKSFFAEHDAQPSFEQIQALVNSTSGGNFAPGSIAFQKCPGFDTNELTKAGITVLRIESEARPDGTATGHESHESPTPRPEIR
jgi:hypothetical protein